ncbi:macrophage mannose receptor 1-like [Embiotoca jacksoni]|uniref:macrophage mannose receptor 1-like n=1 Tax=Embiotoca jacksoni TaxID=100190 RepID=UPI003703FEA1
MKITCAAFVLVIQTFHCLASDAVGIGLCSEPWLPYNGHCFLLNRTQKAWSDAQVACRTEGGDLVSIHNVEDQHFIISQLGYASTDELWIGLNDRRTEGLFDWIDSSAVNFTSWESENPTVSNNTEDCVLISGEKGNWTDRVCDERHGFICMKTSVSLPIGDDAEQDKGCKKGWRRHSSFCFFIGEETKTFDEAKDDCKSSDSYLADVSTSVDNTFLVSLVGKRPEKYFWLGLSNQNNIDEFVWTNEDSVRFTHWNAEMPGPRQGCVAINGTFAGLWDVLPCNNKEKYICKQPQEPVLTPALTTLPPPKCANDWTQVGERNQCFKLFERFFGRKTWYEARDYCRAIGGDLLSIHSVAEKHLLPESLDNVWIGLSAPDPDAGYVWSDGSLLHFKHWQPGQPDNANNVESCVEFKTYRRYMSGSWNDVHCENKRGWLCQIGIGVTPNPPPSPSPPEYNWTTDGWMEWKGNQYHINRKKKVMEDARYYCQQRHGDLVTINSEAEGVFLWKHIVDNIWPTWIGLNVHLNGTAKWMDGSPLVFQRWNRNQPAFPNNDENCAAMTPSMGFWDAYNCGFEHNVICKRSGSPPAKATVAPAFPPKGSCPQNWNNFNSKCYRIINSPKETWEGARQQCRNMGGNLASILSPAEQAFLTSKMAKEPVTDLWIGFTNKGSNSYYWTEGRPVRYRNWGTEVEYEDILHGYFYDLQEMLPDEQSNFKLPFPSTHCAAMTIDHYIGIGKWAHTFCHLTNGYICLRNVE